MTIINMVIIAIFLDSMELRDAKCDYGVRRPDVYRVPTSEEIGASSVMVLRIQTKYRTRHKVNMGLVARNSDSESYESFLFLATRFLSAGSCMNLSPRD